MNIIKRSLVKAAIAAAIVVPMSSAHAGLIFNFYNGSDLYATLTTSPATNFDLHFLGTGDSAGFVNELFLDGPNGTFLDLSTETEVTGAYSENGYNGGGGGGNIYDWKIDFPQPNNGERLKAGEHGLWSITTTDEDAWDLAKIHINAFDGNNSIKIDGCIDGEVGCGGGPPQEVPVPGTLFLLGLGLLGLRFRFRA